MGKINHSHSLFSLDSIKVSMLFICLLVSALPFHIFKNEASHFIPLVDCALCILPEFREIFISLGKLVHINLRFCGKE